MERKPTDFQLQCEKHLTDALTEVGQSISGRQIAGVSEAYIQGIITGSDIAFWIYEDGACIKAKGHATIFENPDFDELDDLAEQFVAKVVEQST